uniref:Uncharacterized protein n=1 Tax=Sus scrofa TaxID=9823 RepID=A0A4X1W086_PIG
AWFQQQEAPHPPKRAKPPRLRQQRSDTSRDAPPPSLSKMPEPSLSKMPEPSLSKMPEPSLSKMPEPPLSKMPEPSLSKMPEPSLTASAAYTTAHGNAGSLTH